ncbi:DNA polymerase domain-containing protein [Eremococcus coleocola]|uniref:DNA polymerase domain-containing protein n=1 Tax=Eremococcus coleocola TaxID=88132 RepID=UPI00041CB348|nr:DNA polymerase domain-containing protein [Eremococcus coleocola]
MKEILSHEKLVFYDLEVFQHDSIAVLKDINHNLIKVFHNNFDGLLDLIRGKTLIGYNNYFYDDHILTYMLYGKNQYHIKKLNDKIIGGERISWNNIHSSILSLDCFQQIDVGMPSLKKVEANLGSNIYESEIDFTIDRPLTPEEVEETIKYCTYDVDRTIDVFKLREDSYFTPKLSLIERLPAHLQDKALRWNTTTISANLLITKPIPEWFSIRLGKYREDGEYNMYELVPPEVKEFWKQTDKAGKGKYVHKEFNATFEFGWGGLHAVNSDSQKVFKNVKLLDVASLYPNIIIHLNTLGTATSKFAEIVNERLSVKHTDPVLSGALKLMINSVYGLLKNQYSLLYNMKASQSVCQYGQIILYDLARRLAPSCKIVQVNTDGIAFTSDTEEYKDVWKEWEEDFGFTLELEEYTTFIQKDVNNYIGVKPDGKLKVKGGDVGRYYKGNPFKNCSNRIVDIAVVNKLVYNIDPLDSIMDNLDKPELFQMVLQAGNTYAGTFDDTGKKYQKVNRVFAGKHGVKLFKQRSNGAKAMYPNSPETMIVWNDEVKNFKGSLDINFYYELINKVIDRWK